MWILPKIHCQPSAWRLGRDWPCYWCWWEMSLGSQELSLGKNICTEWIHNPRRLARRAFKYLIEIKHVSKYCFKPWFLQFFFQVKCFQSPFCCSFCNQQVPFHEMDFLSLNNQDFILNCPRAVIPPHLFCFVAGCPYDSPDLRAWWNSLNSEILSRNNSRRGRFALEIQAGPVRNKKRRATGSRRILGGDEIYYESC